MSSSPHVWGKMSTQLLQKFSVNRLFPSQVWRLSLLEALLATLLPRISLAPLILMRIRLLAWVVKNLIFIIGPRSWGTLFSRTYWGSFWYIVSQAWEKVKCSRYKVECYSFASLSDQIPSKFSSIVFFLKGNNLLH